MVNFTVSDDLVWLCKSLQILWVSVALCRPCGGYFLVMGLIVILKKEHDTTKYIECKKTS